MTRSTRFLPFASLLTILSTHNFDAPANSAVAAGADNCGLVLLCPNAAGGCDYPCARADSSIAGANLTDHTADQVSDAMPPTGSPQGGSQEVGTPKFTDQWKRAAKAAADGDLQQVLAAVATMAAMKAGATEGSSDKGGAATLRGKLIRLIDSTCARVALAALPNDGKAMVTSLSECLSEQVEADRSDAVSISVCAVVASLSNAQSEIGFYGRMLEGSGWMSFLRVLASSLDPTGRSYLTSLSGTLVTREPLVGCLLRDVVLEAAGGDASSASRTRLVAKWALQAMTQAGNEIRPVHARLLTHYCAAYCAPDAETSVLRSGELAAWAADLKWPKQLLPSIGFTVKCVEAMMPRNSYGIEGSRWPMGTLGSLPVRNVTLTGGDGVSHFLVLGRPSGRVMMRFSSTAKGLDGDFTVYYYSGAISNVTTWKDDVEGDDLQYLPDGSIHSKTTTTNKTLTDTQAAADYWPNGQIFRSMSHERYHLKLPRETNAWELRGLSCWSRRGQCIVSFSDFMGDRHFQVGRPSTAGEVERLTGEYVACMREIGTREFQEWKGSTPPAGRLGVLDQMAQWWMKQSH